MEGHTIDEAALLLKQPADYLRNKILFSGKAHPILKPCVFFPEPVSMRFVHRNANIVVQEIHPDFVMKVSTPFNEWPDQHITSRRDPLKELERLNKHFPENAFQACKYPAVTLPGLFELTFYPEYIDMAEVKESDRIQLYRAKAVCAPLANAAVDRIMNNWYAMSRDEISRTKDRTRQEVGDVVILTQGDFHYLVDTPVSISLSDIRIADKMLEEYADNEGIKLPFPPIATVPIVDQAAKQVTMYYNLEEAAVIRLLKSVVEQKPIGKATDNVEQSEQRLQATPAADVRNWRNDEISDEGIAVLLDEKYPYPTMTRIEKMRLIAPDRVQQWEQSKAKQGRPKQWFDDLLKKGRKNMTPS